MRCDERLAGGGNSRAKYLGRWNMFVGPGRVILNNLSIEVLGAGSLFAAARCLVLIRSADGIVEGC